MHDAVLYVDLFSWQEQLLQLRDMVQATINFHIQEENGELTSSKSSLLCFHQKQLGNSLVTFLHYVKNHNKFEADSSSVITLA